MERAPKNAEIVSDEARERSANESGRRQRPSSDFDETTRAATAPVDRPNTLASGIARVHGYEPGPLDEEEFEATETSVQTTELSAQLPPPVPPPRPVLRISTPSDVTSATMTSAQPIESRLAFGGSATAVEPSPPSASAPEPPSSRRTSPDNFGFDFPKSERTLVMSGAPRTPSPKLPNLDPMPEEAFSQTQRIASRPALAASAPPPPFAIATTTAPMHAVAPMPPTMPIGAQPSQLSTPPGAIRATSLAPAPASSSRPPARMTPVPHASMRPAQDTNRGAAVNRRIRLLRVALIVLWVAILAMTILVLRVVRQSHHVSRPAFAGSSPRSATTTDKSSVMSDAHAQAAAVGTLPQPKRVETTPTPAATVTAEPATTADPTSAPVEMPPQPVPPTAEEGVVSTAEAAPGRRVWVDDKLVGQTPDPFTVRCGKHRVRLGTTGKTQLLDVPCAGEIAIK